jgi:hypothetical protein
MLFQLLFEQIAMLMQTLKSMADIYVFPVCTTRIIRYYMAAAAS